LEEKTGRPINPVGRTGLCERGTLGKWGPNHAADPLVIRWKKGKDKKLEFIAIKRKDTGEYAIPGGMVDYGDSVSTTLKKEFLEETQNILEKSPSEAKKLENSIQKLFSTPTKTIYEGYVDDPRNTDNAWMETSCVLFFDGSGGLTEGLRLEAGDDASSVMWVEIDRDLKMYASHVEYVRAAEAFILGGK